MLTIRIEPNPLIIKKMYSHEDIERQTQAFFDAGNEVQKIKIGVSGYPVEVSTRPFKNQTKEEINDEDIKYKETGFEFKYMTVTQVAEKMKTSRASARGLVHRRQLRAVQRMPLTLILVDDFKEFMEMRSRAIKLRVTTPKYS